MKRDLLKIDDIEFMHAWCLTWIFTNHCVKICQNTLNVCFIVFSAKMSTLSLTNTQTDISSNTVALIGNNCARGQQPLKRDHPVTIVHCEQSCSLDSME